MPLKKQNSKKVVCGCGNIFIVTKKRNWNLLFSKIKTRGSYKEENKYLNKKWKRIEKENYLIKRLFVFCVGKKKMICD
jgi:hypothetical protein